MKRTISIAAVTLIAAAVGCGNNNTKPNASLQQPNNQVANLQPPAPAAEQASADSAPLDTSTPVMASDTSASGSIAAAGGTYKVKAGDTLYRIAVTRYGTGKDWKKIAAANPGLDPKHLKVGQTLTMP